MLAGSFAALCTDYYVNSKLAVKMDLPHDRESVLELFSRVRREFPMMRRFRRFPDELALESPGREEGAQLWAAIRRTSVRAGVVSPHKAPGGDGLHKLLLSLAPFYLSINPLDLSHLEVVLGFDLDAEGNHHAIVRDALFAGSPFATLFDDADYSPIDVQPYMAVALNERGDRRAYVDVKARTTPGEARRGGREAPISVFLTVRNYRLPEDVRELPAQFETLLAEAESLAQSKLVPSVIRPLREAIASQRR